MNWFEEQLDYRKQQDEAQMHNANVNLSSIVMGKEELRFLRFQKDEEASEAENQIAAYYGVKHIRELMTRHVVLKDKWYNDSFGAFLALDGDDKELALIPNRWGGYYYWDKKTGKKKRVTEALEIQPSAVSFYRLLPRRSLKIWDLLYFSLRNITRWEVATYLLCSLAVVLVGMVLPYINTLLFGKVLASGSMALLLGVSVMYLCSLLSNMLIDVAKSLSLSRLQIKVQTSLNPAVYMRLLSLPVTFYRRYNSGELSARSGYIASVVELLFGSVFTAIISFLFSFVYLFQLSSIVPQFVVPACGVILFVLAFSIFNTLVSTRIMGKTQLASSKLFGVLLELINGIQKIKLTGSEKRAYTQWANKYGTKAHYEYDPPCIMKIGGAISSAITLLSTLIFYIIAVKYMVTPAQFMAFTVAFGLMNGAAMSLSGVVSSVAQVFPQMEMVKPILKEVPEMYDEKAEVENITGNVELSHIEFRYSDNAPYIFKDLSLKVSSGEYVGIVGKTGCGKSTLVRLLLGFEKPSKGAIYYGQKDINNMNLQSLRRHIGVVLQTSRLFTGTLFSNVAVTAATLTEEQVWKLFEQVGLADDVHAMPMGLYTQVTEGGGGLSSGQMQRVLIARALAVNPALLIFDEATSALDNVTQRIVTDSLDHLQCTKIVIAHRLSTVKNCDRILVFDNGKVVENGTFDELMALNGYFCELVKRQL